MPLAFHSDRREKYRQQRLNAERYIVPFVEEALGPLAGKRVLEIGCGEGGVLQPFVDRGCACVGVDLLEGKLEYARALVETDGAGTVDFVAADVYALVDEPGYAHAFDLVILKDTIEHIHGQDRLLAHLPRFLAPGGAVFVAFPPWRMPYGGHQQMADTRLGKLPYYHLLPRRFYDRVLQLLGENEGRRASLLEIHDTRLSIRRFEALLGRLGYRTLRRRFYLINPIYEYKFGLKPVEQVPLLRSLPGLRDFVTTTCYYLVQPRTAAEEKAATGA
ncbi:MAG: class I SAM-dependent methyltransferase, partial [Rhodothermales bacterium]|nr:class I SAM-dependent methyltransferase [Rhodothermales bacterium]